MNDEYNEVKSPIKRTGMKRIRESNVGVYVWKRANGKYLADTEGNMLNIPAVFGDIQKIAEIGRAAAHYGFPDGEAEFIDGVHRVTEEEYQEQVAAYLNGQLPDVPRLRR